jgi:autotransporter adhesin
VSRKVLVDLDMASNKLLNVAAATASTDGVNKSQLDLAPRFNFVQEATPTGTVAGQTWFATGTGKSFVWYDSFWVEF